MISPQWALFFGIILSFFAAKNLPLQNKAKLWGSKILQFSIILLGSGLNFNSALKEGAQGFLITAISIALVFFFGFIGMKLLRLEKTLSTLITMGTAICGGSAIGALAPVIGAESTALTMSVAIVFTLNAIAVFIFPPLGHFFGLSQYDFGLWSALAIHDTSSVVAASAIYGQEALEVATLVKLTRALWIIPITLIFSIIWKRNEKKITFPWFVLGFLGVSLFFTFVEVNELKSIFLVTSKAGFSLTLFLIGLTFNFQKMRAIGIKPLIFAVMLWVLVSVLSLVSIRSGLFS